MNAAAGAGKLPASLSIGEIPEADEAASALFRHRFNDAPPARPHHVVARHRGTDGLVRTACYVHFNPVGEMLLGGGACVNTGAIRAMSPRERDALKAAGGLYHATLAWAVRHFAPDYRAIFGYCGDALAERVDLAVGFAKTMHPHLLVLWTRDVDEARRAELIARAHAVGPF